MMDPILSLDSITKSFHDNEETCPALAGISFDVYPTRSSVSWDRPVAEKAERSRIHRWTRNKADAGSINETPGIDSHCVRRCELQTHKGITQHLWW